MRTADERNKDWCNLTGALQLCQQEATLPNGDTIKIEYETTGCGRGICLMAEDRGGKLRTTLATLDWWNDQAIVWVRGDVKHSWSPELCQIVESLGILNLVRGWCERHGTNTVYNEYRIDYA